MPSSPTRPDRPRWWLAAVAAVVVSVFFFRLGGFDLLDPDEGRHAEIAREMIAEGNYLTPRLHGDPYYDKPVLLHWSVAASMSLFGHDAAAARLPSALCGLATVLAISLWSARAYGGVAALLTAVGLATTVSFVAIARYLVIDSMLVAILTWALVWLGLWFADDPTARRSIYPFYALIGLGLLAKGPVVVVLPATVALVTVAATRRWNEIGELRPLRGGLLALAIALPWYLAAWWSDPQYIETFLWHHNVERYLGSQAIGHQSPWYYYLIAVPLGLLPWFPLVAYGAWRRLRSTPRSFADIYAAVWAGVVFAFFFPASTKLLTYVVPAFPPLLALAAAFTARALGASEAAAEREELPLAVSAAAVVWVWVIALCLAAGPLAALKWAPEAALGLLCGLPVCALAPLAYRAARGGRTDCLLASTAAATVGLVLVVYGPGAVAERELRGLQSAAAAVAPELGGGRELIAYKISPHSLAFYAATTMRRSDDAGELAAALRAPEGYALVTKRRYLAEVGLDPLPPGARELWAGAGSRVIVVGGGAPGRSAEGAG